MLPALFSRNIALLAKNLDLRLRRHHVLTSNIANAETPGYIAKDLRFEEVLQKVAGATPPDPLHRTHPRHLPSPAEGTRDGEGKLVASPSDDVGRDLNTVSLDQEMARLTTNMLNYNVSTEILTRLFDQLKRTITEGGR
ncbi:MAG: flagellar basal body rod protein FlgB [Nitrospinota bacterium]|nr:MAG: flagellar basal body rod protein FlgB [Nitrospinota bacterium]